MIKKLIMAGALLATAAASAQAQTLSLNDALQIAEHRAFANRIAGAQAAEQAAAAIKPLAGILPTLRAEGAMVRTTDPIGAFGTTLRQRRISQQDFDPARLNFPAVAANYSGGLVIEQPIFNADAHVGRLAANRAATAGASAEQWARTGTRIDVIKAYYGAILAREKAQTLETALAAARAHAAQADKLVKAGLATRSDALLATVKAGEVEAAWLEASSEATIARQQLALVLGAPDDTAQAVPADLPSVASVSALLGQGAERGQPEARRDVMAANQRLSAADLDVLRTRTLYLPRVNAFARYDWNSPTSVFSGDKNWTFGVITTWTPFAGASDWAERRAANARAATASAARDALRAQAELEIDAARSRRTVARARLEIAQRSALQSAEAHRIVTRKYEGGLSSVTELLDAAAAETQTNLALSAARYTGIVAEAEYRRAIGSDPGTIAELLETNMDGVQE